MLGKCPSCGRLFVAKEVSREQLGNPYVVQGTNSRGNTTEIRVENFKVAFNAKAAATNGQKCKRKLCMITYTSKHSA